MGGVFSKKKERLALVWREKLTKQLHKNYFNKMSYYKLSHLNEAQIADVEERIVKDPRRFCKSLAEEMEKFSAACTSGVWFTYKLYTISSLPFAISPLIYFFGAFKAALYFVPEWSQKWRQMLDLRCLTLKQARTIDADTVVTEPEDKIQVMADALYKQFSRHNEMTRTQLSKAMSTLKLKAKYGKHFNALVALMFVRSDVHGHGYLTQEEFSPNMRHLLFLQRCPTGKQLP